MLVPAVVNATWWAARRERARARARARQESAATRAERRVWLAMATDGFYRIFRGLMLAATATRFTIDCSLSRGRRRHSGTAEVVAISVRLHKTRPSRTQDSGVQRGQARLSHGQRLACLPPKEKQYSPPPAHRTSHPASHSNTGLWRLSSPPATCHIALRRRLKPSLALARPAHRHHLASPIVRNSSSEALEPQASSLKPAARVASDGAPARASSR